MESRKVIVVGAGIGGLAAAFWLGRRGFQVEVLEASDRPGGRMVTLEHRGDRVDVGAQFYHSNYRCALGLIDAMGLSGSKRRVPGKIQYALRNGDTHVYDRRTPYSKLFGVKGNLELYAFLLRYVLFGHRFSPFGMAEDIPEYDDACVADLYRSRSDRRLLDYLVTPLTMGAMLTTPEWMSLYHYIRMFRLTLFSSFLGLTGGVSSLAEELAGRLPVRYETPVVGLVMEKGRVVGVQRAGDGSVDRAAHVIVAVTPPAAALLMPEPLDEQRRFFDSVLYTPLPMAVFFLDRPLRRDVLFYFSDPGLRRSYAFAINEHAKMPEMSRSGRSIVTGWAVYPTTLDLMNQRDDDLLRRAKEDIELLIPGFSGWIEDAMLVRHAFVNAIYSPGANRATSAFLEGARGLRGVSFVSSELSGMSIEGAVRSAARAVERVCGWEGRS
jgi:protoporphyrinogen oxidase